jgi:deoxyribonuclease-1
MIEGEQRPFGACDVEIAERKIEPRPEIRGDIARIYLDMEASYPGRGIISDKNRPLFEAWECERERRIAALQGNHNSFVAMACGMR